MKFIWWYSLNVPKIMEFVLNEKFDKSVINYTLINLLKKEVTNFSDLMFTF